MIKFTLPGFFAALLLAAPLLSPSFAAPDQPHAVLVAGTPHYNPGATMPLLARQLESCGFRTTVVSPKTNPEKDPAGMPGLEALLEADVAVFYLRFLTLPPEQFQWIETYLKSGKPVVGFRTSTHAFTYPEGHALRSWNDGFGKRALGSKYFIHGAGGSSIEKVSDHEILAGCDFSKPRPAGGTLYLSDLPSDAKVLLTGTGAFKRTGTVTNGFGTHELAAEMTDDVAWTWTNEWGGKVFATTLGHVETFSDPEFVRLFVNGIHWAAGKPIPDASVKFAALPAGVPKHAKLPKPTAQPQPSKPSANPTRSAQARARELGTKMEDAKNRKLEKPEAQEDPDLARYAIFEKTAPRPPEAQPVATELPLLLNAGDRIAYIGNTLWDRAQDHGHFEAMLQQALPQHKLVVRNLSWSADAIGVQPRPTNFADTEQMLFHEKADVIFAAFGFNESFAGPDGLEAFRRDLKDYLTQLRSRAYNGETAPRIVLISPIANENVPGAAAADWNNENIQLYADAMEAAAEEHQVGYVDVFSDTARAMANPASDLTINGIHLTSAGYQVFAETLYQGAFGTVPPRVPEALRDMVVEKNRQYFRRYRPVNTFYYTGSRNKSYGYLDFLPAMRSFDVMVQNRDQSIWNLAAGQEPALDDSNVPPMPPSKESRGANEWLSAADELTAFKVDERFDVTLFAGEEQFPDLAAPIQMRWDSQGRLWVSCSTTYPHIYPGNEPNDKLVILEDTDGDGKADRSSVWADDLHIPLSFEFGDGGVYVSEEPHLTFLKDTDGDGKADHREIVLTGFGTEDSHHALHDFAWTPDGDLILRESIFHHTQVETPYGPVRQANSGWFRFEPEKHKLTSFGTYHSTNPWGVTFDEWGQHVASHPIYAAAFHALDPAYPEQHPKPAGLQAYSGVCGQEFVDFPNWPEELQGAMIKVRYKPTNRVEILDWNETDFGFEETYQGDLLFSTNLSFIPVDIRYGPRGAMYVCDWYNPVKGHAQYSLRDPRRDRESGRIWRITPKEFVPQDPPQIAGASIPALLEILKRPEYRYRYWAKRELREQDPEQVKSVLDLWVASLDSKHPRFRHHQTEALWLYSSLNLAAPSLFQELLDCDHHLARAAATEQLRYRHGDLPDAIESLRRRANDESSIVRLQAAIAASYLGTEEALVAMLDTLKHSHGGHLSYAIRTSLGSEPLKRHWFGREAFNAAHPELREFLAAYDKGQKLKPSRVTASDANFDSQKNLKKVVISCVKEQLRYTVTQFEVKAGQPVRLTLTNPDATAHNLVLAQPGTLEEIGMAANEMAKDPKAMQEFTFIPKEKKSKIIVHTKMVHPDSVDVIRFKAPTKPGVYPYLCTFPGHWIIMKGEMIVK